MDKNDIKEIIKSNIEDGLLEEAKEIILQYKKIFGYDDEIASMEAIISIYNNDFEAALKFIRKGLEYNIYNSDLYYTMGNVYELLEKYNRAYLCYEHALECIISEESKAITLNAIGNLKKNSPIDVKNYSIVILTYNNLEYTKVCLDSIKKYNINNNYEVIIIDNNSKDGTKEWLKEQKGIKCILNQDNKGFPAGCNQGIEIAEKDNDIFLLNNDTVLMPNSIFNLRIGLYSEEKVGATGAVSNSVSYYQQISEQYEDFNGYMKFAIRNNISNEYSYEERIKLVGFAMLIKRSVLNKVGLLDERFTPGNFEDDDLSLRIVSEGYKLLLCKDSYIHHFGSVSFKENPSKYNDLLRKNSKKMKEKWGFSSENSTTIRYDLINLINENSDEKLNILDMGCGCGATLLAIKNKYPNSNIYGIEINGNSAQIAQTFLNVCNKNIENLDLNYEENFFNYIILEDVLEQLHNPKRVLESIKKYLKDEGNILASISNVMHFSIIRDLLNGNWNYQDGGILDKNSIRFFTKNEIIKVFEKAGYKDLSIEVIEGYYGESDKEFIEKLSELSLINVREEFNAYKYLVKVKNYIKDDEKIIKKFTFLLRRIEFNIDTEETESELVKLLKNNKIKQRTIIDIVAKNIIDKVCILNYLAIKCLENSLFDDILPLLNNAYDLEPQNLDTNYNLAYVLNTMGESILALEYIENLNSTNESIEQLKELIRGGRK